MSILLRNRRFAFLWFGGLISEVGDWVLITALPFYVYLRTDSAIASAAVLIARSAPSVLLGTVAGVFVDRWDRKRTLVVTNMLLGLAVLLLLVVPLTGWLWATYLSAFLESALTRFSSPAERAFLPMLVEPDDLATANSVNGLGDNLARFGGPALGGILLSTVGMPASVLADSASFVVAAALIAFIGVEVMPAAEPNLPVAAAPSRWGRFWSDWLDGLRAVVNDPYMFALFAVLGTATLAEGSFNAILIPYIRTVLHGTAVLFGSLIVAQGVGGIVGGFLLVGTIRKIGPERLLSGSFVLLAALTAVLAAVHTSAAALALVVVGGLPVVGSYAGQQTLLQTRAPDRLRGRVFGLSNTTTSLLRLCGLAAAGVLADRLGIIPLVLAAGGVYALAGAQMIRLSRASLRLNRAT